MRALSKKGYCNYNFTRPLGEKCTAYGNRTRDSSVKGMRLKPLDQRGLLLSSLTGPFR